MSDESLPPEWQGPAGIAVGIAKYVQVFNKRKKLLPLLWQAFSGRRYSLPADVAPDYIRQELDQEDMFMRLVSYMADIIEAQDQCDASSTDQVLAISQWLKYGTPTYFMEREMGEAFLATKFLPDLHTSDLSWRFPAFEIYLPQGLIPIEGTQECVWSILVCNLNKADEGQLLLSTELEDEYRKYCSRNQPGLNYVSLRIGQQPQETFLLFLTHSPHRHSRDSNAKMLKHGLDDKSLSDLSVKINRKLEDSQVAENYQDATYQAYHLALMTLFYWSTIPQEKAVPARQLRPIRFGPNFRSGLFAPRWVGEKVVFKNRPKPSAKRPDGSPRGHHIGHWVCGHQKRQAYGPSFSLRKIIWILPYRTE